MDRKKVEQYRLSLFGRMVMGVSHEVDNHLSVVIGFAELIQIPGIGEKKSLDSAAKILTAGEKIGAIIKQFSHYVRPHAPAAELFPPAELVSEVLLFGKYDLGRGNVELVLPREVPHGLASGDRRDAGLALLALLFNGSEAMAGKGGILTLEVGRADSGWVFTVTDEGPGIPPDVFPRIFEEGFGTKPDPLHKGIGLSVARHLLEGMGGTLAVTNLPNYGCQATLRLPGRA